MSEDIGKKAAEIIQLYAVIKPQNPYSDLGRATDAAHAYQKQIEGGQPVEDIMAQIVAKLTAFDMRTRTFLQPESSDE
jgi:hypothetical protein